MERIQVLKVQEESDLAQVFDIRRTVFVIEQEVPENEEYDEFETTSRHFLAKVNETPAGTARWRETKDGYKLERFAVLKEFRQQGVGSALLKAVLKDLPSLADKKIYLHAQVHAMPLYAAGGFKPVGPLFMECEIPHYKMVFSA